MERKTKLLRFMENVHVKGNSINFAYAETGPIRDCEIARVHAELEKIRAAALQLVRAAI